jgi:hypothetical protein
MYGKEELMETIKKQVPRDTTRIDITNEDEMQWWCGQLSCNEMRLKNAVSSVGPSADAVRRYLKKEVPQL